MASRPLVRAWSRESLCLALFVDEVPGKFIKIKISDVG